MHITLQVPATREGQIIRVCMISEQAKEIASGIKREWGGWMGLWMRGGRSHSVESWGRVENALGSMYDSPENWMILHREEDRGRDELVMAEKKGLCDTTQPSQISLFDNVQCVG